MSKGEPPYRIVNGGKDLCETPNLREAHRLAIHHVAVTGRSTSIFQGDRKILTYFGWKGNGVHHDEEGK